MEIVAGHRNLYRLSLEARPRPVDGFGDVAEKLEPFGVEVLVEGCDQLPTDIPHAKQTDEVVIDVTRPIDLPLIEHALRSTGRKILALQPI